MKHLCLALLTLSLTSANAQSIKIPHDLGAGIQIFSDYIQSDNFKPQTCAPFLSSLYSSLFKLSPSYFDTAILKRDATKNIESLFEARLKLKEKLVAWSAQKNLSQDCVDQIRNVTRAARFMEDYLGSITTTQYEETSQYNRQGILTGPSPYLLVNPKFRGFDVTSKTQGLKSGDLLMVRGDGLASAAISRVGNVDSQFSHLAIVYIEPKSGATFTVEAHAEEGSVIVPIATLLSDAEPRVTVFRHPDAKLAHEAAQYIYTKVRQGVKSGHPIPYDFSLDDVDHSKLNCSELGKAAYEIGTHGKIIPGHDFSMNLSKIDGPFAKKLGITVFHSFLPGDMEFDPQFEQVAEWRDMNRMAHVNYQDIILGKMIEWITTEDFDFVESFKAKVLKRLLPMLRNAKLWDTFGNPLRDKVSEDLSKQDGFISFFVMMEDTSKKMQAPLMEANQREFATHGTYLTPYQMKLFLENMRRHDQAVWKTKRWKEAKIYPTLRPRTAGKHWSVIGSLFGS